jgi:hypothetical protein
MSAIIRNPESTVYEIVTSDFASSSVRLPLPPAATRSSVSSSEGATSWLWLERFTGFVRGVVSSAAASGASPTRSLSPADAGVSADRPLGAKLAALLSLENGWDDGSGIAPSALAVKFARDVAGELGHAAVVGLHVFPTVEGGVSLELRRGDTGWVLDVDRGGDPLVIMVPPTGLGVTFEPSAAREAAESLRSFVAAAAQPVPSVT